jgi:6-pyruvoyltetrahydropterin/6-carboxytetrahydropterin synthase
MYLLKTEHAFDSAHFLSGYEGKCSNIHGHRWTVIAEVGSSELEKSGQLRDMVIDFGDLKSVLKKEVDDMDHALIIESGTLKVNTLTCLKEEGFNIIEVGFRPTAEAFSKYFYDKLIESDMPVKRVTVYETPNNAATYEAN